MTSTTTPSGFARTAIELEELGLAAYNGAATSLTPEALADASRIVSVEARHAAWIRDIVGQEPGAARRRPPISASEGPGGIARTGFVK